MASPAQPTVALSQSTTSPSDRFSAGPVVGVGGPPPCVSRGVVRARKGSRVGSKPLEKPGYRPLKPRSPVPGLPSFLFLGTFPVLAYCIQQGTGAFGRVVARAHDAGQPQVSLTAHRHWGRRKQGRNITCARG
jgi:hypothetical protein